MKKAILFLCCLAVLAFSACAPAPAAEATEIPEEKDPTAVPTPNLTPLANFPPTDVTPQAALLRFSGETPASEVITFTEQVRIRVNWEHVGNTQFEVVFINQDPAQANTPFGSVIFITYYGPTNGFVDYEFIPGTYSVDVTQAGGAWQVWVEKLP